MQAIRKEPPPFPPATFERRLGAAREALRRRGLDALLVTAPANIYYLSAFHTPAYDNFQLLLLPASGEPVMFNVLHESECLVAARSYVEKRVAYPGWTSHLDALRDLLVHEGLAKARVGLDKSSFFFSVRDWEGLIERLPEIRLEDATGLVEEFRKVKSPEEIACIREAARICAAGMKAGVEAAGEGVSDCDIAAAVHHALIAAGGDYMSYPPFVNVGWNSSLVHNTWNGTHVAGGDIVFLELSGVSKRYGAALKRCVAVGRLDPEFARRDRIVHDVLQRTIDAIRPGVTSGAVNKVCLDAFAAHGYTVLKRAGYSMGINFPPGWSEGNFLDISRDNPTVLEPGMVFHLPQPFRVPGEQTVSTSETVLVTSDGVEVLTDFPRRLFRK
ncbi:MAG: aminopeptidase P family protein [Alphaproteobacteria bacterium]|nr:aminopeptidase P family protein [Alphaproteobacteria bacterium]